MIKEVENKSIFEGNHDLIVNPVNCVGVMGKGLALHFKKRYPDIMTPYLEACSTGKLVPGKVQILTRMLKPNFIVNFPTKDDWRNKSNLDYIRTGLDSFLSCLEKEQEKIKSIGIPALGCGLGDLKWEEVRSILIEKLSSLTDYEIVLYSPL